MYHNFVNSFFDLKYRMSFNTIHNSRLELLWNILPIFCLSFIAGPSFVLLYLVEDISDVSFVVKVVGNQ
jgi:heme/copper-type cytochrome/quinol oxidase subunit 2